MDEMAKTLEAYAGGLQQSFESVFERVGQSLSQSAQVMRMMNEVMESAMLQNLWISPVTKATEDWSSRRSSFRVFYFQLGRFQALRSGEEGAAPDPTEVAVASDRFLLTRVRDILDLSPIDGILRDEQGRYRFHPEFPLRNNPVIYLSVKTGGAGDPAFQVTVSAAGSPQTAEDRRRQCQRIIEELETVDPDDSDY
ncbi:hypothetical protein GQ600_4589 [Phytophthora cactorum]|nr:hypothetical protein GQ600_4589 [Phytophthora cactorum]